mmetsp:Transcript_39257/g.116786  ORF Transcript_39257/g.116786 Transcript_39257/m.116786 type:complete len:326 (-) Transcript_39257:954-1931(-)
MSRRSSSTTGTQLTPDSSSSTIADVSGVSGPTVCSGCSRRHCRCSNPSRIVSAASGRATSGLQVPSGCLASGCPSSGRLARLARKCRIRLASTLDSAHECRSMGTSSREPGSHVSIGAMLHLFPTSCCTTSSSGSSGLTYTRRRGARRVGTAPTPPTSPLPPGRASPLAAAAAAARSARMEWSSICASLIGGAPAATLARSCTSVAMKSLALSTPVTHSASPSHTAADATPWSCSACSAWRIGSDASNNTTLLLSGMSSYAAWPARNSRTRMRVYSGSFGLRITTGAAGVVASATAMSISSVHGDGGAGGNGAGPPRPDPGGMAP